LDGPVAEIDLAFRVVHEDPSLAVIDKPGGVAGHALDPRQRGTVAGFLLARYPEAASVGDRLAPGLVHRLDTGTSGLLVAARTHAAFLALRSAWRAGNVCKTYLAIVRGRLQSAATIEVALAHDPADRRRMVAATGARRAWRATTHIEPLHVFGDRTLVRASMQTGVMHQIRVHLALHGHPVLDDALYGDAAVGLPPGRHALHACELRFPHPVGHEQLTLSSALPPDLACLCR
jgi:23S rRNA pseudouridine1911/1915/1917 synthase